MTKNKWNVGVKVELTLFASILLVAIIARLWGLLETPRWINLDEVRHSYQSWFTLTDMSFAKGVVGILGLGWEAIPQIGYFLHSYANMLVGTPNQYALWYGRVTNGAFGVVSICILYAFVRRWWGSGIALMSMAIAATMPLHLSWSRVATNDIDMAPLTSLALLALAWVFDAGSLLSYGALGVAVGLGWYFFLGCKLTTFVVPLILLFNFYSLKNKRYVVATLVMFLATIAPLMPPMWEKCDSVIAFHGGKTDVFRPFYILFEDGTSSLLKYFTLRWDAVFPDLYLTNVLTLAGLLVSTICFLDVRYRVLVSWLALTVYVGVTSADRGWAAQKMFPAWAALVVLPCFVVLPLARLKLVRSVVALALCCVVMYEGLSSYFVKFPADYGEDIAWTLCNEVWHNSRSISIVGDTPKVADYFRACGFYAYDVTWGPTYGRNWNVPILVPYVDGGPYADSIIFTSHSDFHVKHGWRVRAIRRGGRVVGSVVRTNSHVELAGFMQ